MKNLKDIYIIKLLSISVLLSVMFTACEDEVSSAYSTKYKVRCGFTVVSYPELVNCVNNYGSFTIIRQSGSNIIMKSYVSTNSYALNAISEEYYFGLGGLIVGTPNLASDGNPYRVYDLSCPNCDRASYRMSVTDNGRATCPHCGIVYDLNNDGVILERGNSDFKSPRVLYRYRISYDGNMIHMYN